MSAAPLSIRRSNGSAIASATLRCKSSSVSFCRASTVTSGSEAR